MSVAVRRFVTVLVCSAVVSVFVSAAVPAGAQTVMNPTSARFTASADHNTTGTNGLPVVDHYELEFFMTGASAPFQTVSLGKPTPDGTSTITVNFTSLLGTPLAAGPVYTADVAAVGPGGRATSAKSPDSFAYSLPCSYALSPAAQNIVATGGTGSVTVTAGAGCTWTATSSATWLTATSGASGFGQRHGRGDGRGQHDDGGAERDGDGRRTDGHGDATGAVQLRAVAGDAEHRRGRRHGQRDDDGGGRLYVDGDQQRDVADCHERRERIGQRHGRGDGRSQHDDGGAERDGDGRRQDGDRDTAGAVQLCAVAGNPEHRRGRSTGSVTVTAGAGCTWTATSSATWLTVTSGASGSGNGTITVTAPSNSTPASRSATVTAGGQTVTVTQPTGVPGPPANLHLTVN